MAKLVFNQSYGSLSVREDFEKNGSDEIEVTAEQALALKVSAVAAALVGIVEVLEERMGKNECPS